MRTKPLGALVSLVALAVAACGTASGGGAASSSFKMAVKVPQTSVMVNTDQYKKAAPWTIGYADASLSNSARVFVWQYIQYGASLYPQIKKVIRTDANDSTSKQIADVEDLTSRGVDCMIVSATSDTGLSPTIDNLATKHIPVVIDERAVTANNYTTFISLNEVDMGRSQAQAVVDKLRGTGNIVIMQGVAGAGPVVDDLKGMNEVLAKYPNIKVLATQYTDWSPAKGKSLMEANLQAFPHIDGVLADSGLQTSGAYEAVKAANRLSEIKIWTGDEFQAWLRLVQTNNIPAVNVDRPLHAGELAVHACAAILSGTPVPREWLDAASVLPADKLPQYIAPTSKNGSDQWWDWWNLPAKWLPS